MKTFKRSSRRNFALKPSGEGLESRNLMTAGAGNTFALIPGEIADAGGEQTIDFTIDPGQFTLPRNRIVMGIDVAAVGNSTVAPLISAVTNPHGNIVPQTFHSIYDPHLSQGAVASGQVGTGAVLSPLKLFPYDPTAPATYSVTIQGQKGTSGQFLTGFYLPGDADGNGSVDGADLQVVRSALGTVAGDQAYNFDADANRDGRVGLIDLAFTLQNQGVKTTISPSLTSKLDPASDTGEQDRITNEPVVHFTGVSSPGAKITYAEANKRVPEVVTFSDAAGNYNIVTPIGLGPNYFNVTSADSFGQTISGQIDMVTLTSTVLPPKKT